MACYSVKNRKFLKKLYLRFWLTQQQLLAAEATISNASYHLNLIFAL
ncbi:MAG: hypothetical protein KME52_13725 [Desmonostoc geniculatum HA4340-LM1]|nr:hypothetical protein [Desmonostoc geniculatum HA4340-LM1]